MSGYSENIAALRAEYEQKLAEKEAENARLRGASKKLQERALEQAREYERYLNEYISVKLFKDNDRYRDDVYVAVNGQNCIIKRGGGHQSKISAERTPSLSIASVTRSSSESSPSISLTASAFTPTST